MIKLMRKERENKIRWYYDACTLDERFYQIFVRDLTGKHCSRKGIISHLALGEAYGNVFEKGREETEAFLGLIENLRQYIEIVGNDVDDDLIRNIQGIVSSRVDITDVIHLATAIENDCQNVFSIDGDLADIPRKKKSRIKVLASEHGIDDFSITRMEV